ncbi:putative C-type lectin domain family 20 member A isoform X2 [Trichomycterus rosablanca]|uniref:putative C-type lectin domain family 20 member A isoform X2 n=1 Tax=Trichomycterus rosablanca TaxID=2290929 RepID=UPI002F35F97B
MKLNLLLLVCLTEIIQLNLSRGGVSRVKLIKQSLTWSDAISYCRQNYYDLATVKTYSSLVKLGGTAALEGITEPIWIGLYNDVNTWRFSYNDVLLSDITLRKWETGEPDNWLAMEACASVGSGGTWKDGTCTELKPFICYNGLLSGTDRFVGIPFPYLPWTAAQIFCRTFHTDLASSMDETENSILAQIASFQGRSWFGLYRDTWKWVDDTKASLLTWYPGQPDNYYGDEACGSIWNGLLNEERCSNLHYFFCHVFPPVKIQIVKLQLWSDQSVFDPAVQSSILAMLSQKLEEHGMWQNITIRWRADSDGNIFKKIPPTH